MGALYHLKQKLVDFCNVIQENVSRTDTVPSSKVVYDLKADSDSQISDLSDFLTTKQQTVNTNFTATATFKRIGNIVQFYCITPVSVPTATELDLCDIPDGFAPNSNVRFDASTTGSTNTVRVTAYPSANKMRIYNYSNQTSGAMNLTINMIWFV